MKRVVGLYDKLIIYFCCLAAYSFQPGIEASIIIMLISFIAGCLLSYADNSRFKAVLALCLIISAVVIPGLIFFLPLYVFDLILDKYKYASLLAIIPLIKSAIEGKYQTAVIVFAIFILSILIASRSGLIIKMNGNHNMLIDALREMSFKLEKQNRDLVEKQDSEAYAAALNERNRIAREIHDNVGHLLSSSILQAGALKILNKDSRIDENINTLNETLTKAMNSIRKSVHGLYDESIDLDSSIREIIKDFSFCEINYRYNITNNPDKKLKYAFVAIIKEALTNIIKHSDATEAHVILSEHPALYQLVIRDNGNVKSFQPDQGLGLQNMADRVNSLNGNINIATENGFELFISIPKELQTS
ncbi:MAG: sensor histidine kinase [Acetivibrionales bacterium]|jgi:signal transduction histidine kinase